MKATEGEKWSTNSETTKLTGVSLLQNCSTLMRPDEPRMFAMGL